MERKQNQQKEKGCWRQRWQRPHKWYGALTLSLISGMEPTVLGVMCSVCSSCVVHKEYVVNTVHTWSSYWLEEAENTKVLLVQARQTCPPGKQADNWCSVFKHKHEVVSTWRYRRRKRMRRTWTRTSTRTRTGRWRWWNKSLVTLPVT